MITPFERIVFAGTPDFASHILERMLTDGAPVVGVLTQPDRPAGRGRKLQPSAVKRVAQARDLPVQQPASLKPAQAREALAELQPDLMVVAAYGLLLPATVLEMPSAGCWNVHASLLPRWRGAAPVERCLMAGDRASGVCIMEMEVTLDTGPVRHRREIAIPEAMTGGELERALAELGAEALLEVLADPAAWPPQPQSTTGVTYAHKLTRADSQADFRLSADDLANRIRALNPKQPVTAQIHSTPIKLLRARALDQTSGAAPGTVLGTDGKGISIACAAGTLLLQEARVIRGKAAIMDAATLSHAAGDLFAPGATLES